MQLLYFGKLLNKSLRPFITNLALNCWFCQYQLQSCHHMLLTNYSTYGL